MRGSIAFLLGASISFSLVGCGGSEDQLTKAQFLRQGNAICRQAGAEQMELAGHYKKGQVAPGEYEAVTAVFLPPMEKELRRLAALSPPQGDEKEVRAILKAIESGVDDAKADYLDLFVKQTDPFAEANELARKYGFHACAESSHAVVKPHPP